MLIISRIKIYLIEYDIPLLLLLLLCEKDFYNIPLEIEINFNMNKVFFFNNNITYLIRCNIIVEKNCQQLLKYKTSSLKCKELRK